MNAMSLQLTSWRFRLAPLGLAVLMAAAPVMAAEVEKKAEESQAEIERKLTDARMRLDTAAREVAELSISMSEHSMPTRGFVGMMQQRAMLGINLGSRGEELPEGVAVLSVSPGGAAEGAGLKAGDVLLAIDGQPLKRDDGLSARDQLMKAMGQVKPGDKVQLRYRRDNKVATASVTAEPTMNLMFGRAMPMPVRGQMAVGPAMPMPPLAYMRVASVFGSAELVPLTPKLGQYFGTEKGLLVVRAPADSRLKLEDGDVIVDIDGRTPANPTHAFRILGSYQAGEKLKLNVLRQKKRVAVDVTIPDEPLASRRRDILLHQLDGAPMPAPGVAGDHIMNPWVPAIPATPLLPPPPGEAGTRIITIEDDRA
jgi:predicted metalloprotease with PDZ domain